MAEVTASTDGIIHVMPEGLANKIAAGEVVQRPASVVKELVENAIDAAAETVTVLIRDAGSELIQVIDDGSGMSAADAMACIQRHATSKIREIDDLERIRTLGFRGEALASIASVSRVELKTKRVGDPVGTLLRVEGGEARAGEPCSTRDGTSIAVRNLFFNVPARRSFLKTPATEFKHIVDVFQSLALSNPGIGFTLIHQDAEVFRLPAAPDAPPMEALRSRIRQLFGADLEEQLVEVREETSYLTVYGFAGHPAQTRRSRGDQFLFVNERYVSSRYLDHAVMSAYADALPEGTYPFYALFLVLDPRHVDVNVHPSKAEVKFDDERGIYGYVRTVVKRALGMADLVPQLEERRLPSYHQPPVRMDVPMERGGEPRPAVGPFGSPSPSPSLPASLTPGDLAERLYAPAHPPAEVGGVLPSAAMPDESEGIIPSSGEGLLWQLHDRYILTQIRSGLMIVDQNAAHERVLYERALAAMESGFGLSQQMLFSPTVHLSAGDFELVKELLPDLKALGFDLQLLSGRSVMICGVPADIGASDADSIIEDVLEQVKENRDQLKLRGRENLARSVARRSAIRPGRRLTSKEMRGLIDLLFTCEMPYTCPDGRPTMVKIATDELDRRFGRSPGGRRS